MKKEIIKKAFIVFLVLLIPVLFLTGCQNKEVNKQQTQQIIQEKTDKQIEKKAEASSNKEMGTNTNNKSEDEELVDLLNELDEEDNK